MPKHKDLELSGGVGGRAACDLFDQKTDVEFIKQRGSEQSNKRPTRP